MDIGEVKSREHPFTWANNRDGEGFIEEKLDKFFWSSEWMIQCDTAEVLHVSRQASDHSLLVLETMPKRTKTRSSFIFYSKWANMQGTKELVKETLEKPVLGSRMFKVQQKLKHCKIKFIEQRKAHGKNAKVDIELIQKEMDAMQAAGGRRDQNKWKQLKCHLSDAYKEEEEYWCRKAKIQQPNEGDKNTKYFHTVTAERRRRNKILSMIGENEREVKGQAEITGEITKYFETLFTTSQPRDCEEIFEGMPRTISETMNVNLTRVVDGQEIRKAIFSMHPHKAPGPDAMSLYFSKRIGM